MAWLLQGCKITTDNHNQKIYTYLDYKPRNIYASAQGPEELMLSSNTPTQSQLAIRLWLRQNWSILAATIGLVKPAATWFAECISRTSNNFCATLSNKMIIYIFMLGMSMKHWIYIELGSINIVTP